MGQEGHFIPKFIGPWASSGVANPSLSSHSSFWALAHSSSPSSLSRAGSFILSRLPHPLASSHFGHQGGVRRWSRHYWWSICLDMVRGSVACGRAAGGGGSSRGRHYVTLHILICLVHLCACPFETLPQKHTGATSGPGVGVSRSLRNKEKSFTGVTSTTSRLRSKLSVIAVVEVSFRGHFRPGSQRQISWQCVFTVAARQTDRQSRPIHIITTHLL